MESRRPAIAPPYEPSFPREIPSGQPARRGMATKLALWWQHRRFLWRVFWITALLSTAVAFIIPIRFKSMARLVVGEGPDTSAMAGLLSRASGAGSTLGLDARSLLGLKTPSAFYLDVLHSRTVQEHLVQQFDLRRHYRKKYMQDACKALEKYTETDEDKRSGVITLAVTDWDAKFAAMLARSYIEEMNHVVADLNTSAAHREREFLEERLKSARQELEHASMELSEFSSKHTMMDVQQQSRTMMDAAAKLQGELIGSESELKGLEQIYSDDNVRVRTLKARVAELQSQLKKMVGSYATPNEVSAAPAVDNYPSIRTLPALGYRYQEFYRQVKTQETVFDFLTQQYELARVEEAKELPVVRVMDEPSVPEKKSSPVRSLIVGLSVFIALLLGCWWVAEKQKWDRLPLDDSRRLLLAEVRSDVRAAMRRIGIKKHAAVSTQQSAREHLG